MNKQEIVSAVETRRKREYIGHYGIPFLDDLLGGIMKEDFILIGSYTGSGKSSLAYNVAFENSKKMNVLLFALEADVYEPIYRELYKRVAKAYYADTQREYQPINYRNYVNNEVDLTKYEDQVMDQFSEDHQNLKIMYRNSDFTINTLVQSIKENQENCDMIIIDHLQYISHPNETKENEAISKIMQTLRDVNQEYDKPIILVSHLRKRYNKKQVIPDLEDFHGSSNIPKQSKTAILFGRNYAEDDYRHGKYSTFITVPKLRFGGSGNLVGKCNYDGRKNWYDSSYTLHRVNLMGDDVYDLNVADKPYWAKSATFNAENSKDEADEF